MLPGPRQAILFLLWMLLGATAQAAARAEIPPGLVAAETERVVEIVDGDTLVLAGGRQVRLVGIQVTTRFVAFHLGSSASLEARMKPCI